MTKTLKDTIKGMLSKDWKERLVAEIEQCDIRIYDLEKRMSDVGFDDPEYSLLYSQYIHMIDYLSDLTTRARTFNIDYKLPSFDKRIEDTPSFGNMKPIDNKMWLFILLFLMASENNIFGEENSNEE